MKVYICGNLENPQAFEDAEAFLRMHGHIPINPVKILYALPAEINNSDFTVIAFEIIRICDAVYPISGWDKDLLARVEMSYAKRNDKEILEETQINL